MIINLDDFDFDEFIIICPTFSFTKAKSKFTLKNYTIQYYRFPNKNDIGFETLNEKIKNYKEDEHIHCQKFVGWSLKEFTDQFTKKSFIAVYLFFDMELKESLEENLIKRRKEKDFYSKKELESVIDNFVSVLSKNEKKSIKMEYLLVNSKNELKNFNCFQFQFFNNNKLANREILANKNFGQNISTKNEFHNFFSLGLLFLTIGCLKKIKKFEKLQKYYEKFEKRYGKDLLNFINLLINKNINEKLSIFQIYDETFKKK